ncbi:hypothetical protein [Reyranella sp.]|uniref:hypothetical protein n=1 Tax=Reyranella sp. TaxID=1929291 RepID=UPI003D0EE955
MPRLLALFLPLALLACAEPTTQASNPPGAVHYHLRQGTQLLSCVTWGYDTVCRNA